MNTHNNQSYNASPPWFTTWMIIAIVEMLMCNLLSGVITLVLILLGDSDYKQGKIAEAESKKKIATVVTIVGVIFSIIIYIVCILIFLLSIGLVASY